MKLIEIVNSLISKGNKIKYRTRTDGGIIVTEINGRKVGITEGNRLVREMVGKKGRLSVRRKKQLEYNVNRFIKLKKGQHKAKGKLEDDIVKLVRKVQRIGRKTKVDTGRVTMRKVRYHLKTEGKAATIDYLYRRLRYFQGYANEGNILAVQEKIRRMSYAVQGPLATSYLQSIMRILDFKTNEIREDDIRTILEILYDKQIKIIDKLMQIEFILSKVYGD